MIPDLELIERAIAATRAARALAATRPGWQFMGYVGAALETHGNNVYTGINVVAFCGIGFCAEHSAIANMVKHGETKIARIVAATAQGTVIPPCGRCRELIYQIDEANVTTKVIMPGGRSVSVGELLPDNWQVSFDQSLT